MLIKTPQVIRGTYFQVIRAIQYHLLLVLTQTRFNQMTRSSKFSKGIHILIKKLISASYQVMMVINMSMRYGKEKRLIRLSSSNTATQDQTLWPFSKKCLRSIPSSDLRLNNCLRTRFLTQSELKLTKSQLLTKSRLRLT